MSEADELCTACAKVDLFALFTGPRYFAGKGYAQRTLADLGTLEQVRANAHCPLCRMVKHDIYATGFPHPWSWLGDTSDGNGDECDPAVVRCSLTPVRVDYEEDTKFLSDDTKELLATRLEVRLSGVRGCSQEEADKIGRHARGDGFQLLSPESVDPARPLLNGYRATTARNSLELLAKWTRSCHEHHQQSCHLDPSMDAQSGLQRIRVIDVADRRLVDRGIADVKYAALSYVWGRRREEYVKLAEELLVEQDRAGQNSVALPSTTPKVIEDALLVCKSIGVPYLWVDIYCVHQGDAERKSAEIKAMGTIYRRSHITFVAGATVRLVDGTLEGDGLLSNPDDSDLGSTQRIETIGGRKYISSLSSVRHQIRGSEWCNRGWTFQEGHMARRMAFFGRHDVSFMCGGGHWRESMHSGQYGHDANIPGVDLRSEGFYALAAQNWLRSREWNFDDYSSISLPYSQRILSFESDRLDAVSGLLNVLAQKKGIQFVCGLPSADFHYALLWEGEHDRPRPGFPSWSWTGWHTMNQMHLVYPRKGISGSLSQTEDGQWEYADQTAPDMELQGVLLRKGLESPHVANKCSQRLAQLHVSEANGTMKVKSEVARFFIDIVAASDATRSPKAAGWAEGKVPEDFDTTSGTYLEGWDPDTEYREPYGRLQLRDLVGNTYASPLRWYDQLPAVTLAVPSPLRGSSLTWLLRDGIELVRIVEAKYLEGAPELKPFHHVLCLGIDRREGVQGHARRWGVFYVPKEAWDKAGPKEMEVTFR